MSAFFQSGFDISIPEIQEQFTCKPSEALLLAMARLGKKGIPVGCRAGGCGACKVKILKGSYSTIGKMSRAHVTEVEEQQGYVLACRCSPESDLTIKVVGKMRKATNRF